MKLYVLVNQQLSKSQQAVQAGHAIAEYLLKYPNTPWDNGTLVLLKTPDITEWIKHTDVYFVEPDLNDQVTAVAKLSNGEEFKHLKLL